MLACVFNHKIIPDLLNHTDLDINAQNSDGQNALMLACENNPNIIPELLKHSDIDLNQKNKNNKRAIDILREQNPESYKEIRHLFYKKADKNRTNVKDKIATKVNTNQKENAPEKANP